MEQYKQSKIRVKWCFYGLYDLQRTPVKVFPWRVLTARHQIESVGIHRETGDSVKMSHHRVNQLAWEEHQHKNSIYHNYNNNNHHLVSCFYTRVIVEEPDVPILLCRDGDGQRRVTQDFIDLTRRIWRSNRPERIMGLYQSLIMQNHLLLRFMGQFYIYSYQRQELIRY